MSIRKISVENLGEHPSAFLLGNDGFLIRELSNYLSKLPINITCIVENHATNNKTDFSRGDNNSLIINNASDLESILEKKPTYIFHAANLEKGNGTSRKSKLEDVLSKWIGSNDAKLLTIFRLNNTFQYNELIPQLASKSRGLDKKIFLENLYGPEMSLEEDWLLANLLRELRNEIPISIEGEGLSTIRPIFITDSVKEIAKIMFSESSESDVLMLSGEREITQLNLVYKVREIALKQAGKLLELRFTQPSNGDFESEKEQKNELIVSGDKKVPWRVREETSLEEGLQQTLQWLAGLSENPKQVKSLKQSSSNRIELPEVKYTKETNKKFSSIRWKRTKFGVLLLPLIYPLVFFVMIFFAGLNLNQSIEMIEQGELEKAEKIAVLSNNTFRFAFHQLSVLSKTTSNILPTSDWFREVILLLETAELISSSLKYKLSIAMLSNDIFEGIISDKNRNIEVLSKSLGREMRNLNTSLSQLELVQMKITSENSSSISEGLFKYLSEQINELVKSKEIISSALLSAEEFNGLFTSKQERTYFILLQNNRELRPTGGFIGSYIKTKIKDAVISEFIVKDVYSSDSKLKGFVEPPQEIKEYLGESGWYLRDSNWDPDFPTTAQQVEWFVEKEEGEMIDGIIAINTLVIQDLLRILGPIHLEDYEIKVSYDNLTSVADYYSEVNFFPGSSQRQDFLASLVTSLWGEVESSSPSQKFEVLKVIYDSLQKGETLIYLDRPKEQKMINDLGWDGRLNRSKCDKVKDIYSCISQSIAVTEANVGINHANQYTSRETDIRMEVDNNLKTTINIQYENSGQNENWPGGEYKNYLRIYVDKNNSLQSVIVDGKELNSHEIDLKSQHDLLSIGFLLKVPIKQKSTAEITLVRSDVSESSSSHLEILVQKQPGIGEQPLSLSLILPDNFNLSSENMNSSQQNVHTLWKDLFTEDISVGLDLQKSQMVQ